MGKYVPCIQQQLKRGQLNLKGRNQLPHPPGDSFSSTRSGVLEFGWKGFICMFLFRLCILADGITPHRASFNCNKPQAIPKFTWNSSEFASHMDFLLPWCQSCHQSSFVTASSLLHMQMAGWLALVTSTSPHASPVEIPACPTTEQLKLMTSEVFFNLMLLKQKQWLPKPERGWRNFEEWCTFSLFWLWWGFVGICTKQFIKIYTFTMSIIPYKAVKNSINIFPPHNQVHQSRNQWILTITYSGHVHPWVGNSVFSLAKQHLKEAILLFSLCK